MLRLGLFSAVVATAGWLTTTSPAVAQSVSPGPSLSSTIASAVAEAAQRFDIPDAWIRAIMRVESGGDPHAVSSAGAMGLMQVMPATWSTMRQQWRLGADPFDVRDNIIAGVAFLRAMRDRYGVAGMLPAYNAGPGRYEDYLARGRALPAQTIAYVTALAPSVGSGANMPAAPVDPLAWTRAGLFPGQSERTAKTAASDAEVADQVASDGHGNGQPAAKQQAERAPAERLFVALSGPPKP